ncbi:MAG: glycosyltransferase [Dehalococcoidia bacterium]
MRVIEDRTALDAVRRRLGLPERFVLSVGTLEPGKNRAGLLRAVALLRRRGAPHALVVTGQRGWGAERADVLAALLGVADAVHLTGYVADADLPALYNLADAFVFPSWREGFGLPPLEGDGLRHAGGGLRPAGDALLGDAARYAPPDRPDLLADELERVLTDAAERDRLRAAGRRAAGYSWTRAARETLAVARRDRVLWDDSRRVAARTAAPGGGWDAEVTKEARTRRHTNEPHGGHSIMGYGHHGYGHHQPVYHHVSYVPVYQPVYQPAGYYKWVYDPTSAGSTSSSPTAGKPHRTRTTTERPRFKESVAALSCVG